MDVRTLIERAGGAAALAARLGVSRTTVLGWRSSSTIPGNRVVQISAELKVPAEQLLKLVQPPKARESV